jgi:hypothetical protein
MSTVRLHKCATLRHVWVGARQELVGNDGIRIGPVCPKALPAGSQALVGIQTALAKQAAHLFTGRGEHDYVVVEAYSLQPLLSPYADPGIRSIAVRACGTSTGNRSWAVFVTFRYWLHNNRSAALSNALLFAARTRQEWVVWYRYE